MLTQNNSLLQASHISFYNISRKMDLIVFAIFLTVAGAQQSQMEGPQNTVTIVGSKVTLKCSTPSGNCIGVDWQKSIPQTNPETVFSDRNGILLPYRSRYSVDNSSGCDLVINDLKLTDAGRFTCRVFISPNVYERSACLIILNAQPRCAINASLDDTMEGDGVQLTCEVTYTGTHNASMLWRDVKGAPAAVENGNTMRRSYSVVASAPEVPSFTCVTSFEVNATGVTGLASNIPTTACATPAIKVFYPVRDVDLSPSQSDYSPGNTITCMAKGHPTPRFKWQELGNNSIWMEIQGQSRDQFTMSNVANRKYRCVATNVVKGKSFNATSHEFLVNNKDELTSICTCSIGACFGGGFGIGLLAAVVLASIAFASLVKLGYLEFNRRRADQNRADVVQPMKQKKNRSSHQLSSIPNRETASDGQQESAYASLGDDRDTNEYESLEQRKKVKPEKNSRP